MDNQNIKLASKLELMEEAREVLQEIRDHGDAYAERWASGQRDGAEQAAFMQTMQEKLWLASDLLGGDLDLEALATQAGTFAARANPTRPRADA